MLELDFEETKTSAKTYENTSFSQISGYPFKDLTPDLLKRPFVIDDRTNQNTAKWVLNPLKLLMQNSIWKKLINNYSLFRSDMRVRILIKSSPSLFGYLRIVSVYGRLLDWIVNVTQLNSGDTYLTSVAASESIELIIPYKSWRPYFNIVGDAGFDAYHHLYYDLDVKHVMEAEATVAIQTIVELIEPKAAGPCCIEVQSRKTSMQGAPGQGLGAAAAMGLASGLYTTLKNYAGAGTSEPGKLLSTATAEAGKLMTGTDGSQASLLSSVLGDDPTSDKDALKDATSTGVKQSLYGSFNGTYQCPTINRLGGSHTANDVSSLFGLPDLRLVDLVKLPYLVGTYDVTNIGTFINFSHYQDISPSWVAYISRFFRLSCGSIKLSFHFFTSPLVCARYSITTSYSEEATQDTDTTNYQGPSQNFLVRNDTVKTVVIPFHAFINMVNNDTTGRFNNYFRFKLSCIQKPNQPAPAVGGRQTLKVFISGCDDFVFSSLRHGQPRYVEPPEIEVQSLRALHASDCGDTLATKNYCMLPTTTPNLKVSDILRAWDDRPAADSSVSLGPSASTLASETAFHAAANLDQLANCFYLWQGSMEFKTGLKAQDVQTEATYKIGINPNVRTATPTSTDFRIANGIFVGHTNIWPVADFSFPYLSEYVVCTCDRNPIYDCVVTDLQVDYPINSLEIVAVRGGEDFKVFMPQVLPEASLWYPVRVPSA